jgi:cellulose synthase/poly-beta-1,6-N-acetylglucosamine synthase-like glycosyltransferase
MGTYTIEWVFLVYFLLVNTSYLLLNISSIYSISRYMSQTGYGELGGELSDLMPPVTIVIPAYNEEKTIVQTVKSVLQLEYPSLRVVVVNDGSTDETAERLIDHFEMEKTSFDQPEELSTEEVTSLYRSYSKKNLSLVDKENGGKADALNAGINQARTPYVCCIDADSVLDRNCLKALIRPFLFDEDTVAVGGTVRVANGCEVEEGFISSVNLPDALLPLFQVVEYLRAFLFGRMGWDPLNGLMVISGAFGLFDRSAVIDVGGYHTDNVAEDMELVVRMHRKLSDREQDYKIRYIPDPVCWTEVPEDLNSMRSQRTRWQHGLGQSILKNLSLLFKPGSGWAGWLAFPYLIVFEGIGALIEASGYVYIAIGLLMGFVSPTMGLAFFVVAVAFGVFVSVVSFLLEVISFNVYDKPTDLVRLFGAAILENLGYRQVNSWWRLIGTLRMLRGGTGEWGTIERSEFGSESS